MAIKAQHPMRFNDTVLVIGVDIAKRSHVAVAQVYEGKVSKPLAFANSRTGFEQLLAWMDQMTARFGTKGIVIGLEPTGHYWKPLAEWLRRHGNEVRLVPPVFTHRAKELIDGSPLKSDSKDAHVIADLVRQGKSRALTNQDNVFQELRSLSECRHRLVKERLSLVNRLHRLLDMLFPELPALFHRLDCPTVRALLKVAATPDEILTLGIEPLTRLLRSASHGNLGQARAEELRQAASQSIACQERVAPLRMELPFTLTKLDLVASQVEQVEQQMVVTLKQVDYASHLLSIPGIGVITVAIILGEVGDLRGYRHARQVIKKAGLNLYEKSSGQHQSQHHITKRGRAELRRVLFMAVLRMFGAKGAFREYYQRMVKTKAKTKIAVAAMRRLLSTIFALVRDGSRFESERLLGSSGRTEKTQMVA